MEFDLSRVVIVDNGSSDGSVADLQDINLPIALILNSDNKGFAAACNRGAKDGKADYILFLNPDTLLFEKSLSVPIHFLGNSENSAVGIVGIQLVDDTRTVLRTCACFPTAGRFIVKMLALDKLFPSCFPNHFMTEWDHASNSYVDEVMGAFFFVRRSLFESLGGFDERFFGYFEEVDFSRRAQQVGYRCFYLAEAQAYHKGGGSSEQIRAGRLFYSLRSRVLYGYKHFSWFSATSLMLATAFIEPLSRLALGIGRRSVQDVAETITAYKMFSKALPGIIVTGMKRNFP
jgi:GT2 family glycosyltransferase